MVTMNKLPELTGCSSKESLKRRHIHTISLQSLIWQWCRFLSKWQSMIHVLPQDATFPIPAHENTIAMLRNTPGSPINLGNQGSSSRLRPCRARRLQSCSAFVVVIVVSGTIDIPAFTHSCFPFPLRRKFDQCLLFLL